MLRLHVHPENPQRRHLERAVEVLHHEDGVCVYPTDTVYGIGAVVSNPKAIERIGKLLDRDKTRNFSFVCCDFSQMSTYARIGTTQFRILKHYLPGPFTFILPATNYVPKRVCPKRTTVGVRMPACPTCLQLVQMLGEPLANTSLRLVTEEMRADPEEIATAVQHDVDVMLDAGMLEDPRSSTIIDLTGDAPVLLREGKGSFDG
jgi:tRNA threonylcarbamoyl adenosine modification protein (Sua5/YciO/YrdC/YwlC family)